MHQLTFEKEIAKQPKEETHGKKSPVLSGQASSEACLALV